MEHIKTNEEGHLAKIKIGDQEFKVVNSVTIISIVVHKLEDDKEISQLIAHEFMMTDHKAYMIKHLTDAINKVARAEKRKPLIQLAGEVITNRINRLRNQRGGAFGGKK